MSANKKRSKLTTVLVIMTVISSSFTNSFAASDTNKPSAKFEISNITPKLNEAVTFDASTSIDAEGDIASYEWDFKDGSKATGAIVNHEFATTDDFNVKLTVKDAAGNVDTKSKRVFIGRPEGWAEKTHSKSADPDYELLFPEDKVLRIDIKMSSTDYQKIRTNLQTITMNSTSEPIYVPSTVSFNGETWWNVGFRYKGNSSLVGLKNKTKLPFRLNFDEYEDQYTELNDQHFYGFGCMTFGNNWNDNSFMKEKLCGEIFRDGGVPAARSSFCRVYIDTGSGAKYWGLYTMTEDPSDAMLKAQFGDDSGNCYKPEGTGADWSSPFKQTAFIKKNNEEAADWSDVKGAHTALWGSKTDAEAWRKNLETYFNSRSFLRWLAINTAVVNWDCYGQMAHNYYLYNDVANNSGLKWITWDHNLSMTARSMGGGGTSTTDLSLKGVTEKWPLIRRLLDDTEYKNIYHYEMQQAISGCMNVDKVTNKIKAYQTLIKPYIIGTEGETSDVTLLSGGETAFNTSCNTLITHINTRQTTVNTYLKTVSIIPVPEATTEPSSTPTQVLATSTPTNDPLVAEDINKDGVINMADVMLIAVTFNTSVGDSNFDQVCDVNNDGSVNMADVLRIGTKFNMVL